MLIYGVKIILVVQMVLFLLWNKINSLRANIAFFFSKCSPFNAIMHLECQRGLLKHYNVTTFGAFKKICLQTASLFERPYRFSDFGS